MKFNRLALRKAAEDALDRARQEHEARLAEDREKYTAELNEWLEQYGVAWIDAAKKIQRLVKAGTPVTRNDLPRSVRYSHDVALWDRPGKPRDIAEYRENRELRSLVQVLDTVADDEVSHTALSTLGISGTTLKNVVAYLGVATVRR